MSGKNTIHTDKHLFETYRKEFPVTESAVYLDHAGVAPVPLRVKSAIDEFLAEACSKAYINYDSWMDRVEQVRSSSAGLVGAHSDEIAFVKNTSHGISIVAGGLDWREGDNVIVFEKEFPSNIYPWLDLERKGVKVKFIPSGDGIIRVKDIESLVDSRTRLVSMSSVQSVNGFMINLPELGELCRHKGVLLFVDAIQSLGAVPMNVRECNVDFLSADGHKWLLAPEGTGIFYCRKELCADLTPNLIGWKSVVNDSEFEKIDFTLKNNALRFEEGSQNVMGIYALGASLDLLFEIGIDRICQRVHELGEIVMDEAMERGFQVMTPRSRQARGGIVSFSGDFDPAALRERLMASKIIVNHRGGALRVAPHFYNTEEEILILFQSIDRLVSGS